MQVLDKVVFSTSEPPINCLWIKPTVGGVCLYIFDGYWKILRLMNDHGTQNPDDDTPIDIHEGQLGPDTVGTEQIIDNSVMMKDLNSEVADRLDDIYTQHDESLYINGTKPEEI